MPGCASVSAAAPARPTRLAGAAVADPGSRDAPGGREFLPGWDAIPPAWDAIPPTDEELWSLASGYDCGPPDGDDAWAMGADADLPFLPRDGGPGAGFAVGGAADSLPPGVTLAGLASGAWAAGLERLTDDQLIGVLPADLPGPLASWLGASGEPGEVAGFGAIAAADSRALAERLAGGHAARWCLTLTGQDGRAVAHGCAGIRRKVGGSDPGWELTFTVRPLAVGDCLHQRESAGYQPSPGLRHVIMIRQRTCCFPGCRRPASRCDQDHTVPHDRGGRTCECNLAPLCRHHHRCKQAEGWCLEQPEPGLLVWRTPSGRTCTVTPTVYPV